MEFRTSDYREETNSLVKTGLGASIVQAGRTELHAQNSIVALRREARIQNGGVLIVRSDGVLTLAQRARVVVEPNARLVIHGQLILDRGATLVIASGMNCVLERIAAVHVHARTCLRIETDHNCILGLIAVKRSTTPIPTFFFGKNGSPTWDDDTKDFIVQLLCALRRKIKADLMDGLITPLLREHVCPRYGCIMPDERFRMPTDGCHRVVE